MHILLYLLIYNDIVFKYFKGCKTENDLYYGG